MSKTTNDSTLTKLGDIFQYYIALKCCFKMKIGDTLQIETNGDVSIIAKVSACSFQMEVKHHLGKKNLIDRDVDFWKTLSNWYKDYERIKKFPNLILYTTAAISTKSVFKNWNEKDSKKKLDILKNIGSIKKSKEKTFREYYDSIFNNKSYLEEKLLCILSRFTIEHCQNQIEGISSEFSYDAAHIPEDNRDQYIAALLGQILSGVKDYPHKWEVTREDFEKMLQQTSPAYSKDKETPLPNDFADLTVSEGNITLLKQKRFVTAILDIEYESVIKEAIEEAISDYWKAKMTVIRYFKNDLLYVKSLPGYKKELKNKLKHSKGVRKLKIEGADRNNRIKHSQILYSEVMTWDAKDFGSIIRNQGYFQRGIIHTIVDNNEFSWDIGEKNEY